MPIAELAAFREVYQQRRDPSKRILLDQLPRLLRGYVNTPGIDAVVVVLDADERDCVTFLNELRSLAVSCSASHLVLFRLAIEETEAWYLGDRAALQRAYPKARMRALDQYIAGFRLRDLGAGRGSRLSRRVARDPANRMALAWPNQA